MYVIVNPKTLSMHGRVYKARREAVLERDKEITTYGITTDFVIYELVSAERVGYRGLKEAKG